MEFTWLEICFMGTSYLLMVFLLCRATRLLGGLKPPAWNTNRPYAVIDGKEAYKEEKKNNNLWGCGADS